MRSSRPAITFVNYICVTTIAKYFRLLDVAVFVVFTLRPASKLTRTGVALRRTEFRHQWCNVFVNLKMATVFSISEMTVPRNFRSFVTQTPSSVDLQFISYKKEIQVGN